MNLDPNRILPRALPLLLAVLGLGACSLFNDKRVEAEVRLDAGPVLVLPFAEGTRLPFQSDRGFDLAALIQELLVQGGETGVRLVSWDKLESAKLPENAAQIDPLALGRQLEARYLLNGRIIYFSTRRPGATNILQGEAAAEFELIDLASGVAIYANRHEVVYPDDYLGSWGISSLDETDEGIERGLLRSLALAVTKPFVPERDEKKKKR